ncbi:hypothetical protein CDD83_4349 [Cordyceps sp. RAO-2017]|nr:hypothetical protein CDD83_4349 [Cordyceps sp. RAO-2017]
MTASELGDGQAGLPSERSSSSFWLREPSSTLLGHRTTAQLPAAVDVAVVGSGITGAFAARTLVGAGRDVLMLEAREACWGATGRNGGHCQPGVWYSKPAVARFELATFDLLAGLVADEGIACDWHVVGGVHPLYTPAQLDAARAQIQRLQRHPDLRTKALLVEGDEALAEHRVPGALGAIYQPAAAKCWPYKLVAWVLERLLRGHDAAEGRFNLQTHTPVLHLQRAGGGSWIVHTPRGQVAARHVVLATNAYTSYLLPRVTGLIVPVQGQVCALRPPPGAALLAHSYAWAVGSADDYMIQRSAGEDGAGGEQAAGAIILGGERGAVAGGKEGVFRDDLVDPVIGRHLRRALCPVIKLRPGAADEEPELEAAYEWTGAMGYSRDTHPWVGRVPAGLLGAESGGGAIDTDGLWISAGYTGHGMPVAARCGIAVAEMMLGREGDKGAVVLPDEFRASDERAAASRTMALPRSLKDRAKMMGECD